MNKALPADAHEILDIASNTIKDRGKERDSGSERSMAMTVSAFNVFTKHNLIEEEGWLFMECLKIARGRTSFNPDNFVDGAAYTALKYEAAKAAHGS